METLFLRAQSHELWLVWPASVVSLDETDLTAYRQVAPDVQRSAGTEGEGAYQDIRERRALPFNKVGS